MQDTADPGTTLVAYREWIEKVAGITCRRNSVWGDDADDFASLALMKVMENDYAVLRKFRGDCDIKTYLATVVVRRFHEYTRERWGRWRHSARAQQLGEPARTLEALVHRDGYTLREAVEFLHTTGRSTLPVAELTRLFAQLPAREPRPGSAGAEPLESLAAPGEADYRALAADARERCRSVMNALFRALDGLEPDDKVLVRGRFGEGRSVADLARMLGTEQAPLYRKSERLRDQLRRSMEEAGVRKEDVLECLTLDEA
ncbi:MAG TPA: sigma-70 family RNA polymerase sigma factor [Longimicrobium sp.]|jgi:RNA polymerase sigma factor for flagellar operon FliA